MPRPTWRQQLPWEQGNLDFLADRTKDGVYRALLRLEHRERIRIVAMDMSRPYLMVQKLVFPKAMAVVDKVPIVCMAS